MVGVDRLCKYQTVMIKMKIICTTGDNIKKTLPLSQVTGYSPPRPCVSFAHFNFDSSLLDIIKKSEFTTPTPIQSQAIPTVLSGRDIIGVAKTGSGKTAAYLWPLLVHCMDQEDLTEGEGPIGLICSPTRELCQQVRSVGLLGCTLDPVNRRHFYWFQQTFVFKIDGLMRVFCD